MQFGGRTRLKLAARQGLEPRYHGPKPCVLPLDDRAIKLIIVIFCFTHQGIIPWTLYSYCQVSYPPLLTSEAAARWAIRPAYRQAGD